MPSALVSSSHGSGAPSLVIDLENAGFLTIALSGRSNFVQDVIKRSADMVVCFELIPDEEFFECMANLARLAPRPVVVFTTDADAAKIALAVRSGIHAYVIDGYDRTRLRPVLQLAQARFEHDQAIRQELAEVSRRFAERKLVDRAKGILMGARQLREDEAFRSLRSAAMASKQRIGQVSQIVINSALFAEAMNRAGQLRMLSQRLVKLYALACAGILPVETAKLFADSVGQAEANLAILGRSLSKPTMGDLIDSVVAPWKRMCRLLDAAPSRGQLRELDAMAEEVLLHSERLTTNLEIAAYASALRVINISGRQRMLCQRLAKEALMASLFGGGDAAPSPEAATHTAFVQGLAYLEALPMSNATVRSELAEAAAVWVSFQEALAQADTEAGRAGIAILSEMLLGHFDRLTDELERAMQALV